MRCILAIAFTVVLIATEGNAMPASDVENQQTTPQPLEIYDEVRKIQTTFNALYIQLQKVLNLPNKQEYINNVSITTILLTAYRVTSRT
ncbi:hypothetical protein EAI_11996 [Harpegnathos saltator]|uniref:Uncharacterized protein n=1 Tax=Harpegnathos saltator TaxID=610380 RepID=E2BLW1_HARSA|nr:hypothetical protein EAI_11996 [Harpegnathos saltator]